MTIARSNFSDRIARIERDRITTQGKVRLHVGDREMQVRADSAMLRQALHAKARTRGHWLSVVPALLTGLAGVVVVTALRVRFLPPEIELRLAAHSELAGFGMSLAVAVLFGVLLNFFSARLLVWQAIGVVFALASLHNAAFWQPALSDAVFTPSWVQTQQDLHEPRTLALGGIAIGF